MTAAELELVHSGGMYEMQPRPEVRSPREVYEEFYDTYGNGYTDEDGNRSMDPIVNGRVLHVDGDGSRATHLIVHEMTGHFRVMSTPGHTDHGAYVSYGYEAKRFVVATTDGQSIRQWNVIGARGMHHGYVNAIDYPYRPENETIYLTLENESAEGRYGLDLAVRRTTAEGMMRLPEGKTGWILGEEESRMEREYALNPDRVVVLPRFAGHVAAQAS